MTFDAWITLAVILLVLIALAREILPPAACVLAGTTSLLLLGVIDDGQAFSGFSNAAPLTVAALYVLARAADKTGLLGPLVGRTLGSKEAGRGTLAKILLPTAGISGFINNTPLVAMLIPEVTGWAARHNLSPSRLLLPISYAAMLGGTLTLIGTSTNLVVSGLLEESGQEPLGFFEITPVGAVVAICGLATLIGLVPALLPARRSASSLLASDGIREFVVEMIVESGGSLDGKTVAEAGLRDLEGVYLIEIQRNGTAVAPVAPNRRLSGGDKLRFVGRSDLVLDLQRKRGLVSSEAEHLSAIGSPGHTFFEAVIGGASPLVGRTLKEVGFRSRFAAAVVAIHRAGERVDAKFGEVELRGGDTLLILAAPDFRERWREGHDFLLVAEIGGPPPAATSKAPLVGAISAGVILLAAFDILPILHGALLAIALLIGTRVLTVSEARDAVDLDVIVMIAAAFGLGAAMDSSGLAGELSRGIVELMTPFGTLGIIVAIVLATSIMTEIITNNAAAVVIFPIAIAVGVASGIDPRALAIAVAVTASASFLTPMGYQTNTMVYGPGGYKVVDYLRAGMPLNIVVMIAVSASTYWMVS